MDTNATGAPPDMLLFIQTPVAKPLVSGRNTALLGSVALALVLFAVLRAVALSTSLAGIIAVSTLGLNVSVVMLRFSAHASTPLAVNMNHPFVDDDPLGEAKVMVRMSNGQWIDPGMHRARAVPEELLGGHNLVQDTDDYPVLGHFTEKATHPVRFLDTFR